MNDSSNKSVFSKIVEYFIGPTLEHERDTLKRANVKLLFYVNLLAGSLLFPLTIYYFIDGNSNLLQEIATLVNFLVFATALFVLKKAKNFLPVVYILLAHSYWIFILDYWIYDNFDMIQGIHLAINLFFSFYMLPARHCLVSMVVHIITVSICIGLRESRYQPSFIKPFSLELTHYCSVSLRSL